MQLRKYAIACVAAATLFTTGIASAAKIHMTRVQVNGVVVVDSQGSENIEKAVKDNLGKAIIVIKRTDELVAKHKSGYAVADESLIPNGGGGQKLSKMFRLFIDGKVKFDTQRQELILKTVKENLGKVDEIVIQPRVEEQASSSSSVNEASTSSSSSSTSSTSANTQLMLEDAQKPLLLEGPNAEVYQALGINSYDNLPTAHQILGVKADALAGEIKVAYHALAQKWHPDHNSDKVELATKVFSAINEAYSALS